MIWTRLSPKRVLVATAKLSPAGCAIALTHCLALLIRRNERWLVRQRGKPLRHDRGRADRDCLLDRDSIIEPRRAMKVRIDGKQPVKVSRQKAANDSLTDRLACVECPVLPHVAEVGCNERQAIGPELASGRSRQLELDQLAVGLIQAATEDHILWQRARQANQAFTIRKLMDLHA